MAAMSIQLARAAALKASDTTPAPARDIYLQVRMRGGLRSSRMLMLAAAAEYAGTVVQVYSWRRRLMNNKPAQISTMATMKVGVSASSKMSAPKNTPNKGVSRLNEAMLETG